MKSVVLTTESASNLDLIVELAHKLHIRVEPVPRKIKEVRDNKLLKKMLVARESGLADTQEVLNKLGITL